MPTSPLYDRQQSYNQRRSKQSSQQEGLDHVLDKSCWSSFVETMPAEPAPISTNRAHSTSSTHATNNHSISSTHEDKWKHTSMLLCSAYAPFLDYECEVYRPWQPLRPVRTRRQSQSIHSATGTRRELDGKHNPTRTQVALPPRQAWWQLHQHTARMMQMTADSVISICKPSAAHTVIVETMVVSAKKSTAMVLLLSAAGAVNPSHSTALLESSSNCCCTATSIPFTTSSNRATWYQERCRVAWQGLCSDGCAVTAAVTAAVRAVHCGLLAVMKWQREQRHCT